MGAGIDRLIMVSCLKADEANQDAMEGADKARDLVAAQKDVRARARKFEDFVRDNQVSNGEMNSISRMLNEIGADSSFNLAVDGDGIARSGDVSKSNEAANAKEIEAVRRRFEDMTKDLESQDKLGNFEIQDLMSRYNQAETLASSIQKKDSDTEGQVIGKI